MNKEQLLTQLSQVQTKEQLEARYQSYLGKKGSITTEFKTMGSLDPKAKKEKGQLLSDLKNSLEAAYADKEQSLSMTEINQLLEKELVDISLPATPAEKGHYSLLVQTRREMEEIAQSMGFIVATGSDVVTKYENFETVNIPITHPATEMHDTIYVNKQDQRGENYVLRTHTSSAQNYVIKKYGLPIKAVLPGRCYRFDEMDATHDTMFYQLEGIYIDKNVSIANFKNVITTFLSAVLKKEVEVRMRPAFFPFVEPGFEIDARYEYLDQKTGEKTMSKWLEILGAGMIHPNVLKEAGVESKEGRTGFAFGIGINRVAAMKFGIKDIRYFTNGDLRFIKSFA
ncbi:MAG: phenylalanine--tRNA ligase subunit alpha [Candidatus Absconditabacteria bacterium]|nr:phenylalanine--tRNA ligase subunit alpha [Candidatus Absconditabacteria bacterium]MDD3868476.1 phenylalanine--tRNA ligase subunit alpha [Candidatus Absconditabacteria bacterium]MDD4713950.1 phenylalanine--tRNA ligase subunit alpha [Candidatus Absconditabacteria bacterium]